jgi:hypothetical protein
MKSPTATAAPLSFDPLHEALAAVNSCALAQLMALEDRLRADEPELVKRTAAGDVQAAAQLTVNRVRLNEVLPGEIREVKARQPKAVRDLWDVTSEVLDQCARFGEEVLKEIGGEVNAAVAPALGSLEIKADLSGLANRTPRGQRAETLVLALKRIEADDPRNSGVAHLNPNSQHPERDSDYFKATAIKKANRLLAAWTAFGKGE